MSKLEKVISKAKSLGATDVGVSRAKGKKYYVIYNGKRLNFGASGMDDFLDHKDAVRRKSFRARAQGIKRKDGTKAYADKSSPLYWSYNVLW